MKRTTWFLAAGLLLAACGNNKPYGDGGGGGGGDEMDMAMPDVVQDMTMPDPDLTPPPDLVPLRPTLIVDKQEGYTAPCTMMPFLGTGTVTANMGNINCGQNCQAIFPENGISVTLTATPGPSSRFAGWDGACANEGTTPTCTIMIQDVTKVVAKFDRGVFFAVSMTDTKGGGITDIYKGGQKLDSIMATDPQKAAVKCFEAMNDEVFELSVTVPMGTFYFGNSACVAPMRCSYPVIGPTLNAVVLR